MRGHELLDKMELVSSAYVEAAGKAPKLKKRSWIKYGAVAACLCVVMLAALLAIPNPDNAFVVKAYALEPGEDNTVQLKEADVIEEQDVLGGHFDGENFYLNVGLKYDGKNIKSVEFTTENGFFAKQDISKLKLDENVSRLYVGEENRLAVCGDEFEHCGSTVTLNDETDNDNTLLFWGIKSDGPDNIPIPEKIEIQATATFNNGKTQTLTVPVYSRGEKAIGFAAKVSKEKIERANRESDYYMSLPLEKCELIEDSVETVTDVYEVRIGWGTSWIEIRDDMEFDENGIYRSGFGSDGKGNMCIPVIKRDADGGYTGMIYRVPESLRYTEK